MLPISFKGEQGPLLVMLHWLGGSSKTFTEMSLGLSQLGIRCAAIDLPGFGDAATATEFNIEAMTEEVTATIAHLRRQIPGAWFLAGHSMGGKLTAILARAAAQGRDELSLLAGIVLISSSPPGPEPMKESKRIELMQSLGHSTGSAKDDHAHAAKFVDENTGNLPLNAVVRARAIADIERMNRGAFRAWLTTGSKEDWSERVGTLDLPALVLAGTEDPALGPEGQRTHTLSHLAAAHLAVEQGGGHLGPLERPAELVHRIVQFVQDCGVAVQRPAAILGTPFSALIASDWTSPQTRAVMNARLQNSAGDTADLASGDAVFNAEQQLTLKALVERIIPGCNFDLARRLCAWLAQSQHDGWRNDQLPSHKKAWEQGLASLNVAALHKFGVNFSALDAMRQDDLLAQAKAGALGKGLLGSLHLGDAANSFNSEQLQIWFEDVRAELARLYVADPRTMERIGFTGFADDHGFTQIELGQREVFER